VSTSLPSLKNKELGGICPSTLEAEVESQILLNRLEIKAGRAVESQKAPTGRSLPLCDHCGGVEEHGNSLWSEERDGTHCWVHADCLEDWRKRLKDGQQPISSRRELYREALSKPEGRRLR